jgi:hypothetical protein
MAMTDTEVVDVAFTWQEVFGQPLRDDPFFELRGWDRDVAYFVGRNGSGKSRVARLLAQHLNARFLSTDRLTGLMRFTNWGWTSAPDATQQQGVPLGDKERSQAPQIARNHGTAIEELYALREMPEVSLRVAAFVRRALSRSVELREVSGFLDPHVQLGESTFSLLRDEGHGLRELVVLLTATYRPDWSFLVVDEPELHLHPAMARLWLAELQKECARTNRRAIVVTHEPGLVRPKTADDLRSIWLFAPESSPQLIGDQILAAQEPRVAASLEDNPELVSALVFSPRPVLVEGTHDVAAMSAALTRTQPAEVVEQTDLIRCGGTGGVALWFEIATKLSLDVRAVADLDALFDAAVRRAMDARPDVTQRYQKELGVEPPTTVEALKSIQERMGNEGVDANPRAKAEWLTDLEGDGHANRRNQILQIWRDAGLWLHPQNRLEHVLGLEDKGISGARHAASEPGEIDAVAAWAAYHLDPTGDIKILLGAAVERIAHHIVEALRLEPERQFNAPVGPTAAVDDQLVDVTPIGNGGHRLTVKVPDEFAGYWVEFTRDTPPSSLTLGPPN